MYSELRKTGEFDFKTFCWLKAAAGTCEPGGAIFGGCRHGQVFEYCNGAGTYSVVRGPRGKPGPLRSFMTWRCGKGRPLRKTA
jgi:hypothetical protein